MDENWQKSNRSFSYRYQEKPNTEANKSSDLGFSFGNQKTDLGLTWEVDYCDNFSDSANFR